MAAFYHGMRADEGIGRFGARAASGASGNAFLAVPARPLPPKPCPTCGSRPRKGVAAAGAMAGREKMAGGAEGGRMGGTDEKQEPSLGTTILLGRVQSGKNDASHWLRLFNDAYVRKTGMAIFPGSLNLLLDLPFDWYSPAYQSSVIPFNRQEVGGQRDILLLPCRLRNLEQRMAFLWSTTTNVHSPDNPRIVEIITDVKLRERHNLADGDMVEVVLTVAS
jgi:riboflavin kinase